MNEPENPLDQNGTAHENPSSNAAPSTGQIPQGTHRTDVPNLATKSNNDTANPVQPEYGQMKVPEYGAMASQFPPQYNPYVYGKPEEKPKNQNQQNPQMNAQGGQPNQQMGSGYGNAAGTYQGNQGFRSNTPYGGPNRSSNNYGNNPNNSNNPFDQPYNNGPAMPGAPGTPGYQPDIRNGIDMNDPAQNPLKGHWDPWAIISIVLLFLPIMPFLPAITGAVSMWRTKKYHMKGFWAATVCMVLGVITTVFSFWLFSKGINVNELSQQLMNQYGSGSGGSSGVGSDGSVHA
ncbi:hypothetical protein OZX72_05315 [Bifidobacterium sp. ESL0769]|uniref:hypothetical protein n=1 Tax=Bifidobacterium sp. ESL0769 TaxID=2983229 RepID=UPI0023F9A043|nr:hypothetical protein [Bifidobacterium sp. ESL0769]WEV66693.1 hypothetical protein OZX72_05315 [Bifidobacterium sp. ESL0769]